MKALLNTSHGDLPLPAFLPDATRGVVRGVDAGDLRAAGVDAVVANAFHLSSNPGCEAVESLGGLHAFMNWTEPVACDSGGFQIMSMLAGSAKLGSVTNKGFRYRPDAATEKELFTPAKSIRRQVGMGADVVMCLDHCTDPAAPGDAQRESVEHTVEWARRSREEFDRATADADARPLLFAVIQGGDDAALRRECAERLFEIGFDGYGFGGWPIDREGRLTKMVRLVAELVPAETPTWALGVGKPEHVVACAALGYDLFDCVLPTRDARHRRLYAFRGDPESVSLDDGGFYDMVHIQDRKYVRDGAPVGAHCDCACCAGYSRAYLHHLFHIGDALAPRLATIHNLRFYTQLTERLRRRPPG